MSESSIGPMNRAHFPGVRDSWLGTCEFPEHVDRRVALHGQGQVIDALLADPTVTKLAVRIPFRTVGWLVGQKAVTAAGDAFVLHYVHVTAGYRRMGWASRLRLAFDTRPAAGVMSYDSGPTLTTHHTLLGDAWLAGIDLTYIYNPYIAWANLARAPTRKRGRR